MKSSMVHSADTSYHIYTENYMVIVIDMYIYFRHVYVNVCVG